MEHDREVWTEEEREDKVQVEMGEVSTMHSQQASCLSSACHLPPCLPFLVFFSFSFSLFWGSNPEPQAY